MKRKQFTEQQIIGILKEHEAGAAVADLDLPGFFGPPVIGKWPRFSRQRRMIA